MPVDQRPARPVRLAAPAWTGLMAASALLATAQAQELPALNAADRDLHTHANPRLVRVKHLELDLKADFEARELRGTVIHEIERASNAPARTPLTLDTRDLTIEAVATQSNEGGPWLEARHQLGPENRVLGRALTINLPADAKRVRVTYTTSPSAAALQWLEPAQTAGGKHPFLFSQSEAIQARSWIPLQDSPAVRITYKAAIQVPRGLTALMAADQLGKEGNTFRFEMPQAIPPYLIALAIGDLAYEELGPRTGVRAEPTVVKSAAFEFAETEEMVKAVEARFGPYRWDRYELLVLPPSFPFGGMENPKLTFATPTVIAGDRSLVELVAHELAHSWSGNLVSNATWRDFWLNEGFTVYLERRIVEDVYGPDRRAMEDVLGLQTLRKELAKLPGRTRSCTSTSRIATPTTR
ncbi:MAG: M1 family aminopeptidase/hydrolase [Isosphaeraceae bacterium]